jgi:MFS transporter, PAT family, beta-lactamase induction signal transducer AmpG
MSTRSIRAPNPVGSGSSPPFTFFFLHACTAWPVGVIGLALSSSLVNAGVPVQRVGAILAVTSLAFTFEFVWAPMVDSSLTRRRWFVIGTAVMCACIVALLVAPWHAATVPLLTLLAFCASSGAAAAAVSVKGIMAYETPAGRLSSASGYYTAGGTVAKAVAGAGTLWLLTHLSSRPLAAAVSAGTAALLGSAIVLTSADLSLRWAAVPAALVATLGDLWRFVRTPNGVLTAVMCVIPFGAGTEAGLIGAIAREWAVTPDQLATFGALAAVSTTAGAALGGWLSMRLGSWNAYLALGWSMIVLVLGFAWSPRTAVWFMTVELVYRAMATASYATLLGIVMKAIGQGAASTKAAALWSLANLAFAYPTLIEGRVHDRAGTVAMLVSDAGLGIAGFGVLLATAWLLKLGSGAQRLAVETA